MTINGTAPTVLLALLPMTFRAEDDGVALASPLRDYIGAVLQSTDTTTNFAL